MLRKLGIHTKQQLKELKGDVYVFFCINAKGKVCDIKVIYSDNKLFNNAAIRIIKKSSKHWKAGYVEGNNKNLES